MPILPPPDAPADWAVAPGVEGAPEPLTAADLDHALTERDPEFFDEDPDA